MEPIRVVFAALVLYAVCETSMGVSRPNIVIFLADDLGIGDLACFGNKTLKTPHLDKMARDGAKLTQHFSGASFCTPSRAALLTGRYPIRSGMAPFAKNNIRAILFLASEAGLPSNETTFAELAKSVGYKTAYIGKWHLGLHKNTFGDNEHSPMNQGFDHYYGIPWTNLRDFGFEGATLGDAAFPLWQYRLMSVVVIICFSAIMAWKHGAINAYLMIAGIIFLAGPIITFVVVLSNIVLLNDLLMRNNDVVEQPIVLETVTQRFVNEAVEFLDDRAADKVPFLLFIAWHQVHTHLGISDMFKGKSQHGRYGDGVMELDWGVGEVQNALDDRGFGNSTFSYFSSDNGGHLEEMGANGERDGGWNGIYMGGKTHGAVDGGIRVPTIIKWPGKIPPNTVTAEPSIFMDVLPTVANIIGASVPRDRYIDGKDMIPHLTGRENTTRHTFMVHYCGDEIHAARYRPDQGTTVWKLVYKTPMYWQDMQQCLFQCTCYLAKKQDPPLLFDITEDPSELHPKDYSKNKELQKVVAFMQEETVQHRRTIKEVPNQYTMPKLWWNPRLQPCCGTFPFCNCVEKS